MRQRGLIGVYIMASRRNGTLYIGVSSDLVQRVGQHKEGATPEFTRKYGCKLFVWYELHDRIVDAIEREKKLKRYLRRWKLELIESANPTWRDLYEEIW